MNCKKLLATLMLSSALFAGCSMNDGDVILKVNGQKVTKAQYSELFDKAAGNSMFSQMGIDVKKDPNSFIALMIKDKVVNELIIKSLIDQEISKRNIKVSKADTDAELESIISKIGSKEKFNEILKQNGISSAQFKKDLVEEVKMKKLVKMLSKINITEADAKKFYKENKAQFQYPDRVRASHILISADPENIKQIIMSDKANKSLSSSELQAKVNAEIATKRQKADKLLADVKKHPESFAKFAEDNSDDTATAKKGGDLGYFAKQDMVEPFSKVAFSIKPNTVSEIVQTPYGFHIIIVKDRVKAGMEPYEKVKGSIIAYLENQAQVKVLENLIESLKKQAKIDFVNPEYNPENIQKVLKEQSKNQAQAKEPVAPVLPNEETPAKK